jgi:shikimate kinase
MPVYDIDDDHLEPFWNCSVADKLAYDSVQVSTRIPSAYQSLMNCLLSQLGDEQFVIAEGEALASVKKQGTVISLTGSNPLAPNAISTLKSNSPGSMMSKSRCIVWENVC